MFGLKVVIHVQADKRQEFIQALRTLAPQEEGRMPHTLMLQGIDDTNLICHIVQCHDAQELDAYVQSQQFRALRGAIAVLGCQHDLQVIEFRSIALG